MPGYPGSLLIALFLVVMAACSSGTVSRDRAVGPSPEPTEATEVVEADEEPEMAPLADVLDFTAPAVGGGRVAGSEFAGRDVAMWFWAPT